MADSRTGEVNCRMRLEHLILLANEEISATTTTARKQADKHSDGGM